MARSKWRSKYFSKASFLAPQLLLCSFCFTITQRCHEGHGRRPSRSRGRHCSDRAPSSVRPSVVVAAFTFTNSVYWGCAMLTISKGHLQGWTVFWVWHWAFCGCIRFWLLKQCKTNDNFENNPIYWNFHHTDSANIAFQSESWPNWEPVPTSMYILIICHYWCNMAHLK